MIDVNPTQHDLTNAVTLVPELAQVLRAGVTRQLGAFKCLNCDSFDLMIGMTRMKPLVVEEQSSSVIQIFY
jgi:hypothetical protein